MKTESLANRDKAKQEWLRMMEKEQDAAYRYEEQERLIERMAMACVNGEKTNLK